MEKISLKLAFLAVIALIAFCSSFSVTEAREMEKEGLNCIGGCPSGQKDCNCIPVSSPMTEIDATSSCHKDKDCAKFCPKGCKIMNCNGGRCFCEC
ncbi:PREDICTED: putative defensin-like protein 263 [Tarenaya hassleriana]|uniref:putative defensin-like protein 263 n=1 Tax=Tarenaya hassleriana TaxID=28532 RepID=UPI0008FD2C2E|nr:PREDICTED: putative defensin-like protein 263 [Tarenaya hassleriana]